MGDMGGIASSIGSVVAADKSAGAQQDAIKANGIWQSYINALNNKAQKEANELNYQHWLESRGAKGSAILPEYAKKLEGKISSDLSDMWSMPKNSVADFQSEMDKTAGARNGARSAVGDIFNGGWENKMLADFAPVKAARTNLTRQSSMDALSKTLGEIQATQAGKGYEGDGMASNMMRFQANRGMGDALASVNLQNLMDERGIKDQAINNQITYANLPYQMATNDINMMRTPEDTYVDLLSRRLSPLSFMKIGGSQAYAAQPGHYENMPTITPVADKTGLMWQGIANMANGLQSNMNQYRQAGMWNEMMGGEKNPGGWAGFGNSLAGYNAFGPGAATGWAGVGNALLGGNYFSGGGGSGTNWSDGSSLGDAAFNWDNM